MYIIGKDDGFILAADAREESDDQLKEWAKRVREISEYANFTMDLR